MLMALLFAVGLALLVAFIGRGMLPAPWNRVVFLVLGVPAFGLLALGLGLTIYSYATCNESTVTEHSNADRTRIMAIHVVDCGDPDALTHDVTVSLSVNGKRLDRTILRSHGRPSPTEVEDLGHHRFRVTMSDGTSHETTLAGEDALPDRVWSIIEGKILD
ncbi:hypothetical protein L2U69_10475 [Zavarzinia compransoris]|uniref:hypothetical protein n=1 Tax=Zavarzinia marina TaxID=2911065 RepID=UPI001F36EF52|nr:hypothetical protein [Zavarzinia marina]MCF4166068.1 hypothetical protein [Zavarzinia marina]